MYGIGGERRLPEYELPELPGYGGAAPVRVGNAAYLQRQWDIFGEVMVALHGARTAGLEETRARGRCSARCWASSRRTGSSPTAASGRSAATSSTSPTRARWCGRRSTAACAAIERVRAAGRCDRRWAALRDRVRDEILARGYDAERNTFVQHYGTTAVDASLLQLSQIGFVEADDPRMLGTVAAIEEDLMQDGLLLRYRTETGVDGLAGTEHPFLACSFWLVEQYAASGLRAPRRATLMGRLVTLVNDVGLLSEEYDPRRGRQMGNIPQALSHLDARPRGGRDRRRGAGPGGPAALRARRVGRRAGRGDRAGAGRVAVRAAEAGQGGDEDLGAKPRQAREDAAEQHAAPEDGRAAELPALRALRARRVLLEGDLVLLATPRAPARRCASTPPPCRRARTAGGRRPGCRAAPGRTGSRSPGSFFATSVLRSRVNGSPLPFIVTPSSTAPDLTSSMIESGAGAPPKPGISGTGRSRTRTWVVFAPSALPERSTNGTPRQRAVSISTVTCASVSVFSAGIDARLVGVRRQRPIADLARGVAGAAAGGHRVVVPDVGRAQHLGGVGAELHLVQPRRLLHRDQREHLEQVALQHVDQGAGVVVVAAAPLEAERLVVDDLDALDAAAVPHRLEELVGEAQPEDVQHHRHPEEVIDAEHLLLRHQLRDQAVEGARGASGRCRTASRARAGCPPAGRPAAAPRTPRR